VRPRGKRGSGARLDRSGASFSFRVDAEGRLLAGPGDARRLGLSPGDTLRIEAADPLWVARRPVLDLAKVYVEPDEPLQPHVPHLREKRWDAPSGFMSAEVFDAVIASLGAFPRPPTVFLGGSASRSPTRRSSG